MWSAFLKAAVPNDVQIICLFGIVALFLIAAYIGARYDERRRKEELSRRDDRLLQTVLTMIEDRIKWHAEATKPPSPPPITIQAIAKKVKKDTGRGRYRKAKPLRGAQSRAALTRAAPCR